MAEYRAEIHALATTTTPQPNVQHLSNSELMMIPVDPDPKGPRPRRSPPRMADEMDENNDATADQVVEHTFFPVFSV